MRIIAAHVVRAQFWMIAEKFTRRIMVAAAVAVVTDAAVVRKLLTGLFVNISAKAFLATTIGTSVFHTSLWKMKTITISSIVHCIALILMYQSVSFPK